MKLDMLKKYGQKFAFEILPTLERTDGMNRLCWHKEQGDVCILVSASLDVYLEPWARNAGFDA